MVRGWQKRNYEILHEKQNKLKNQKAWDVTQVVEHLSSKHKALSSIPSKFPPPNKKEGK
jgi:hypothetical protein